MSAGLRALYTIGENPVQSEPDSARMTKRLSNLEHFVVQDIFLTKTAQLAHVVLPAAASWCETEGTFVNSERRVQRVRKALEPPEGARNDIDIMCAIAARLGHDLGYRGEDAERIWDEVRSLASLFAGMSYRRLEELGGIQWPCFSEDPEPPSNGGSELRPGRNASVPHRGLDLASPDANIGEQVIVHRGEGISIAPEADLAADGRGQRHHRMEGRGDQRRRSLLLVDICSCCVGRHGIRLSVSADH